MRHFYENVRGLGNVVLSRHAQARAGEERIRDEDVDRVLRLGADTTDGPHTVFREHAGIRVVVIVPAPNRGARLVTTMYRIQQAERAR